MLAAFISVALMAGRFWPWHSVVHEDGERTLLETVFYFEHATRELPLDIVLAIAIAGAVRFLYTSPPSPSQRTRRIRFFGIAAVSSIAAILIPTAVWSGGDVLLQNLAQMPTRAGSPLVWGDHWRYHLLSRLALILLALATVGALRFDRATPGLVRGGRRGLVVFAAALAAFAGATILFGLNLDPFNDVLFLGHQARELFTHALVTLPLAIATTLLLAGRLATSSESAQPSGWPLAAGVGALLLGGYLAVGVLATEATAHGQTDQLATMIFPHFFEHTFSYLVVSFVAGFVFLWSTSAD